MESQMNASNYHWIDAHITRVEYRSASEAKRDGKHEWEFFPDLGNTKSIPVSEREKLISEAIKLKRVCLNVHKDAGFWRSTKEDKNTWHSWCRKCQTQIQYGFDPLKQ